MSTCHFTGGGDRSPLSSRTSTDMRTGTEGGGSPQGRKWHTTINQR